MKIMPISSRINPSFKSNEPIAFDDAVSRERRNFIRNHYDSWHNPYSDIYASEHRLSEYSLKKMVDFYSQKPKKIVPEEIPVIAKRIDSCVRTNNYRGQTLAGSHPMIFEEMKKAGFKTIIDLGSYGEEYKESVEKSGMKFFDMPMENFFAHPIFKDMATQNDKNKFVNRFVDYIKVMQEGNTYIACDYGTYRTDDAVMLNSFFNPKANRHSVVVRRDYFSDYIKTLYKNLTSKDKLKMGWDENWEKQFAKMLKSVVAEPFRLF